MKGKDARVIDRCMIRRGQNLRRIFLPLSPCPRACGAPARRGRAAFSKYDGVLNQPLAWMMPGPVRCITNRIAKILAFAVSTLRSLLARGTPYPLASVASRHR